MRHDKLKSLIQTRDTRSVRVFLIGVELKSRTAADVRESLAELEELATTAGTQIIGEGVQKLATPVAATYIGGGKAEEFAKSCKANDVDTVIFDDELSPAQTRNLEKIFGCKIMDRTALILEIFGQRARTREGKLQIEHAQLKYLLPRLTRFWSHLSRQRGSTGSIGGEGESQLESDRRKISRSASKKFPANWTTSAASARRSAPAASAAIGRWLPSSATRTRANPRCSTRSPARACWPRTNYSPRSTRRRGG